MYLYTEQRNFEDIIKYSYQAFGVTVASQIPLPELKPYYGPRSPDVNVNIGKVFMGRGETGESKGYYQGEKELLLFRIKDVGSYRIKNGREIVIEPAENAEIREVRLYLLGFAFGALLWQRGILPVHGSAVKTKESCFIITGGKKAGKSTLAAAFVEDGYEILTDDIAPVYFDREGNPWVYPSYPQQKLWKESLELLGKTAVSFSRITERTKKYAVKLRDGFCQGPQRVTAIYEIKKADCQRVTLSQLYGLDKLDLIMNNVYRYEFAEVMGCKEQLFRQAHALAQKVNVSRMTRPGNLLTINEEKMHLVRDLTNKGEL
ncbi:MAG: hypothetical protein ACOX4H_02205 [Bacillota bacterium]|jgi:hypothetical protein|nr:hypothetical protein [Clostridia bacterium]